MLLSEKVEGIGRDTLVDLSEALQVLLTKLIEFIPQLIVALITFGATCLVAGPVARATQHAARRRIADKETVHLLSRIVRWSVLVAGTIVALSQVNFDVTGFLAGLGIAGITVGFALQDIARNFIAGVLLLARQPFRIGDVVKVAGYTGEVEDITTRDTVVRTLDGEKVILANLDVLSNPITNYAASPRRRRTIYIGLGYGQDVPHALQIFRDVVASVPGVLEEPAPGLLAEELGDSAITLAARFWVDPQTHSLLDVHSNVVLAVNAAAEREGIDLPYPIQTVRLVEKDQV